MARSIERYIASFIALSLLLAATARAGDPESDGPESSQESAATSLNSTAPPQPRGPAATCIGVAYGSYLEAYTAALRLHGQIDRLLNEPSADNLGRARAAYLEARNAYASTEAFRFDNKKLNTWPIRGAFIDYIPGRPGAGFINDPSIPIRLDGLDRLAASAKGPEAVWGYPVVEFLLWGQDGKRPASDYARSDPVRERRAAYLLLAADRLVADLRPLLRAWEPDAKNEATTLADMPLPAAMQQVLGRLAKLAGSELAVERIGKSLARTDGRDLMSEYADGANAELLADCHGIWNAYFGGVGSYQGPGLEKAAQAYDPELARRIARQLIEVDDAARALVMPLGAALALPRESPERKQLADLADKLKHLAALFRELSAAMDVKTPPVHQASVP